MKHYGTDILITKDINKRFAGDYYVMKGMEEIESHLTRASAVKASYILNNHELKNKRIGDYYVLKKRKVKL